MDPLSIALGVAPLCLTALKACKALKRKISQFRENSHQILRFRKLLKTQMLIFREESLLLLWDAGVDPDMASDMICDYAHEDWELEDVEGRIIEYLGEWYDDAKETSKDIGERITAFENDLSPLEDNARNSKLSEAAYRIKVSRHRASLEEGIELLRNAVDDFRRLRKRRAKMVKSGLQRTSKLVEPEEKKTEMPPTFLLKARCLASFVESFTRTWTCIGSDGTHSAHSVRLFLDSDVEDGCVNSRIALEYGLQRSRQRSLILLQVKSEADLAPQPRPPLDLLPQQLKSKKARKLHVKDSPSRVLVNSASPRISRQLRGVQTAKDLCNVEDMCRHIFDNGKALHRLRKEECVGYFVSTVDSITHRLIAIQDRESTELQTCSPLRRSLATIVQSPGEVTIPFPEQLRLALRLAQSVLQYHSTDWWRKNWSLEDIWFFDDRSELSKSLATLHIDKAFAPSKKKLEMGSIIDGIQEVQSSSKDDKPAQFGVRNITLYCLGVALLRIGHWISIDTSDVTQVGKAESRPSQFGRRYDRLTRRCLHFDFDGFDSDLNNRELQGAIYHKVIRELMEMVNVLEGKGGD